MNVIRELKPGATTCTSGSGTVFFVPVEVQGSLSWAIADSGAGVNVISQKFLDSLPHEPPRIDREKFRIRGANGAELRLVGKVALELSIAGTRVVHPFTVAADLTNAIIIGTEVFDCHHAQFSFRGEGVRALDFAEKDCAICERLGKVPEQDAGRGCEIGDRGAREGAAAPFRHEDDEFCTGTDECACTSCSEGWAVRDMFAETTTEAVGGADM
jgi:hypothetical protein